MLGKIKELLQLNESGQEDQPLSEAQCQLACAALMVEVAVIDGSFEHQEMETLRQVLIQFFGLDITEIDDLIRLAREESAESTSMYQFTQLVNNHCDHQQKFELITGMWRVAYADGSLDKYEEYIVRKSADLIHLPHADFIRAKLTARPEA